MSIIKTLALILLSFLLFLLLTIFGVTFMLNQTLLNPDFLALELDRLDVSALVKEAINEQTSGEEFPEDLRTAVVDTVTALEPRVKEETSAVIHSVSDYLRGGSPSPDLALTLGNTFLNSDFVVSVMDGINIPSIADQFISKQLPDEEFRTALLNTLTKLEPSIKEQAGAAADPIFNYLLGKSQDIDLALTLRNTILNSDFVVTLVNELDTSSLVARFLREQLTGEVPQELEYLFEQLDDVAAELEPVIKREISTAADPILDYLVGKRQSISVVISLAPVMDSMKATLREKFLESPPSEYADLSQSELDRHFDELFSEELAGAIPPSFELNQVLFGTETPRQIAQALAKAESGLEQGRQGITEGIAAAEDGLTQARQYVSYFQLGYKGLIALILLLVLGIILINHQVKGASRWLGITFLIYGAFEYAGIFAVKNFIGRQIPLEEMPSPLQTWVPQLIDNFLAPLQMFSLGLLIGGIALIIVSLVYKRRQIST